MTSLSVLMATHAGERPDWLRQALDSVFAQTRPAEQVVLVLDGPVGAAQEAVIAAFPALSLVRRPVCSGLADALNDGLTHCTGDVIARMDSDDIALPHRFERQLAAWRDDIDVLAAWSAEFEGSPNAVTAIKTTPAGHRAIAAMLKWRCGITHPSILIRKAMLERVGGYRSQFNVLADYDLYVRILMAGGRFDAVQEPLVLFRVSHQQRLRRGGWSYAADEVAFRRFCRQVRFLSVPEWLASTLLMVFFRLSPPGMKKALYRLVRVSPATRSESLT